MRILTDTLLTQFIKDNRWSHSDKVSLDQYIQPASLDLPVGSEVYHVKHPFLAFNHAVEYITKHLCVQKFDCSGGCTLYKNQTYLIPCMNVTVPEGYQGRISPKSSLGRIDVHIRAMVDHGQCYDYLQAQTESMLRLQVTPQSFNIHLTAGQTLTQIMIGKQSAVLESNPEESKPQILFDDTGSPVSQQYIDNHLVITTSIPKPHTGMNFVGYKARTTDEIIDLAIIKGHDSHRFFDIITISGSGDHGKINLEQGRFYILATKEYFQVPLEYSLELLPSSHLIGEMRAHYAGFFDPGFGLGCPSQGVLEVRPFEDMVVYDGQPVCLIKTFKNIEKPSLGYGQATIANNYQGQSGARLAKYFV